MSITLTPAKKRDYKFTAIINGKEVNFGREPYEDFTQHKDEERKRYIWQDINLAKIGRREGY